jgi:serine/threonine protein phosphatase 1
MIRSMKHLLGGRGTTTAPRTHAAQAHSGLPHPAQQVYVIGDIHGRADLLERILERIDAHIGTSGAQNPHLAFVGDYLDHGPDSATVLIRLRELTNDFPGNVTCLMGNHERMLLDFLNDPATRGPRWLRSGAGPTLESFGLHTVDLGPGSPPEAFLRAARSLRSHLPDGMADWLAARPLSWHSGNLWVVHAGADPRYPMAEQSARVLIWGHPEFDSMPRGDGIWIAHGHTEVGQPSTGDGRINTDTGAWHSGRLTACAIRPDGKRYFLQT